MKKKVWGIIFIVLLSVISTTKTFAAFEYIGLKENEEGTYDVLIWAVEEGVKIEEVRVTAGGTEKKLFKSAFNSIYKLDGLESEPTKVTIEEEGGVLTEETFLEKPTVNFKNGYNLSAPVYRQDVQGELVGSYDLFYTLAQETKGCSSSPCAFTMKQNGLLTAIQEDGIKRTSRAFGIQNINKQELRLFLVGGRDKVQASQLTFQWNYPLQSGTIECKHGTQTTIFTLSANTTSLTKTAHNTNYICTLTGTYAGEILTSNETSIPRNQEQPISGDNTLSTLRVNQNVYIEESRIGMSYFINIRRSNSDVNEALLPVVLYE